MNGYWDRVAVVVAELVAIGLVILFSGRLVLAFDRKSGLFKTALALFVLIYGGSLSGCTSRNTVGGDHGVGATNQATAPHDDAESTITSPTAPSKNAHVGIPLSLAIEDRWPRFKTFWQKLDRVEPTQRDNENELVRSFGGPYANALTGDEQAAFRGELASILGTSVNDISRFEWHPNGAAPSEGGELDPLTALLARLSLSRIERMGVPPELMSRMMPPPSSRYRGRVVEMLEGRIDSLLDLTKRADVEPAIVRAALEKIQNDVHLVAVLDVTRHYHYGYWAPLPDDAASGAQAKTPQQAPAASGFPQPYWAEPSAWVRGFEEAHRKNLESAERSQSGVNVDDINRIYRAVREKLDELERLEPQLDALVAELER